MLEGKVFIGGLDTDTEDRLLENGDYRYALNIRNSKNEQSSGGAIENVLGNELVEYELPGGTNKTIGYYSDSLNRIVYYFVYNSYKKHLILEYDIINNKITKVLEHSLLNFQYNSLILHVDKVGDLLYWTDGYNHPRKINIKRAKANEYPSPFLEKYINNIVSPPLCSPQVEYYSDTSINYNNVRGQLYQMKYKYVYADGEESSWSPISKVPLPNKEEYYNYRSEGYLLTINNAINISILTGDSLVKKIKIAVRETNIEDFKLIETLDKDVLTIQDDTVYIYKWKNDRVLLPIDLKDSNKLYDSIPLKAECQSLIDGRRLSYINITEGYDLIKPNIEARPLVSNVVEKGTPICEITGSDKRGGYFGDPSSQNFVASGGVQVNIGSQVTAGDTFTVKVSIAYNNYSSWFNPPSGVSIPVVLTDTFTYTAVTGDTQSTITTKLKQFVQNSTTLNKTIPIIPPKAGFSIMGQTGNNGQYFAVLGLYASVSGGLVTIGSCKQEYIQLVDNNNGSQEYYVFTCGFKAEASASSVFPTLKTFKRGSRHTFGIVYYDDYNRSTTTITDESLVVPVGWYSDYTWNGQIRMEFDIKHTAPKWAKKYQILYGGNRTIEKYNLSLISNVQNISSGVWSFKLSAEPSTMAGYRLRFIGNKAGTTYSWYNDFAVTDYNTGTFTVTIYSNNFTPYNDDIVEFYLPKNNKDEIIYYEIGECYNINDGMHEGNIQNQTPTQFARVIVESGDVYLRSYDTYSTAFPFELYNYSSHYASQVTDIGRPNKVDNDTKQITRPTTAYYTEPYIPGTNINGLSTVYDLSFESYDELYGAVKKVYAEDGRLLVFQQKKVGNILINESVLTDSGGNVTGVQKSSSVLYSKMQYYSGEYGIGNNPESFAVYGNRKYFVDVQRGAVLRLGGDGITPISEYKMKKHFSDLFSTLSKGKNSFRIHGVYDIRYNEYIIHVEVLLDGRYALETRDVTPIDLSPTDEWLGKTVLSAETVNYYSIQLVWNDTANNETGWEVWRSLDNINFSLLITLPTDAIGYLDENCQPSTTYFYKVRAVSNNGNGQFSNTDFASTPSMNTGGGSSEPCADATYDITDSAATTLYSGSITSGGNLNQTIADATIENSDASYTTTVVAEGIKILSDINLTQPNGSVEAKKSNINLSCTQIDSLDNADLVSQLTAGQVTAIITGRRELVGNNPNSFDIQTGMIATTSYATGDWKDQYDAGYLTVPAPSSTQRTYMLDTSNSLLLHSTTPNPWGHYHRFCSYDGNYYDFDLDKWKDKDGTDLGTQTRDFCFDDGSGNVAIFDIYTSRCWQKSLDSNGATLDFATAATNAAAITAAGLTWRLPTIREFFTIISFNLKNADTYVPDTPVGQTTGKIFTNVAGGTRQIWTANVNPNATTYNYTILNAATANNLIGYSLRSGSASRISIAVANFTNADLTL